MDRRSLWQKWNDSFNNWVKYSPTAAKIGCLLAPPGYYEGLQQDVATLKGERPHPIDSPEGGPEAVGYGPKILVPNIQTERQGGLAPFGSTEGAHNAKGYGLAAEVVTSGVGCLDAK